MKRLAALLAVSFMVSVLFFSGEAQAKIRNMPFKGDQPFFVTNGKITFPATSPISVTRWPNGSIKEKVFNYGSIINVPWPFQPTITYNFAQASRHRQGQVLSIVIQQAPYSSFWTKYDIEYAGKRIKSISMTNSFGRSIVYEYNANSTLKSTVTRVQFHGYSNILAETVSYAYTYYNINKVKSATKTVTTYYTDPDHRDTFGKVSKTQVITEEYDRRGNIIVKPTVMAGDLSELNQKLAIVEEIINNKDSIPQGVAVVGDPALKTAQANSPVPSKK